MRKLLSGLTLMVCRSGIPLMFTSRRGVVTSSFISDSRSVPPARISTSPQLFPRRAGTCSLVLGLVYSNGCMVRSLIEGCKHPVRGNGHEWNAHANRVGHSIGDGGHRRNGRRLAQANGPTLVI